VGILVFHVFHKVSNIPRIQPILVDFIKNKTNLGVGLWVEILYLPVFLDSWFFVVNENFRLKWKKWVFCEVGLWVASVRERWF
jgi:uncharacterized membrane protein YczE